MLLIVFNFHTLWHNCINSFPISTKMFRVDKTFSLKHIKHKLQMLVFALFNNNDAFNVDIDKVTLTYQWVNSKNQQPNIIIKPFQCNKRTNSITAP